MKVTLIVRVLDADDALLGWGKVDAQAKGDQCLWAVGPCVVAVTTSGAAAITSVHWPDLHVQSRTRMRAFLVAGETITLVWPEPIMRFHSDDGPLPAVTVGESTIPVPVRVMGVEAH